MISEDLLFVIHVNVSPTLTSPFSDEELEAYTVTFNNTLPVNKWRSHSLAHTAPTKAVSLLLYEVTA